MYQAELYSGLTIPSRPAARRAAKGLVIMMIVNHFGDRHDDDIKDTEAADRMKMTSTSIPICAKVKPPGESFNDNVWHLVTVSRVTQRVSDSLESNKFF